MSPKITPLEDSLIPSRNKYDEMRASAPAAYFFRDLPDELI
jgi:hypothetical protein